MTHLFISHSTRDGAAIAQQLSHALEAAGHRCWIAPRDVKPGVPYPGQIVTAIEASSGLVLIVTPAANESPDILQEVQLASTARKTIAPVIVSACAPGADLRYYLGVRHQISWENASTTSAALSRSFPIAGSSSRLRNSSPLLQNAVLGGQPWSVRTVRASFLEQSGLVGLKYPLHEGVDGSIMVWTIQPPHAIRVDDLLLRARSGDEILEIQSPVVGTVAEIVVPIGGRVRAGQLLAWVRTSD